MSTEDMIIQVFCLVDDQMKEVPKHSQAKLYPSELVTIGLGSRHFSLPKSPLRHPRALGED